MQARRALLIVAAGAAACFPAVTFLDDEGVDAGDAGTLADGSNGGGDGDAPADANDGGGPVPDAPMSDGSDLIRDAVSEPPPRDLDASPDCDVDMDGYKAAGPACGGRDCDDRDPRANPGVTEPQTFAPTDASRGDWNCTDGTQKLHPYNVSCSGLLFGCGAAAGFSGNPGCGEQGEFVTCQPGALNSCSVGSRRTETQACL